MHADGGIEFRDLDFRYPGSDRAVLDHVSPAIEPGQTVAPSAPPGSGKSTPIHLLPRLFDPPPGTVSSSTASTCSRFLSNGCAAHDWLCHRSRSCSRSRLPRMSRQGAG